MSHAGGGEEGFLETAKNTTVRAAKRLEKHVQPVPVTLTGMNGRTDGWIKALKVLSMMEFAWYLTSLTPEDEASQVLA